MGYNLDQSTDEDGYGNSVKAPEETRPSKRNFIGSPIGSEAYAGDYVEKLPARQSSVTVYQPCVDEGCPQSATDHNCSASQEDLLTVALTEVVTELNAAMVWPAMNSAHEGYGVLLEEVDELWSHVKTKQKKRDLGAMRKEAIQVAAMAVRFAIEICNEERGRK